MDCIGDCDGFKLSDVVCVCVRVCVCVCVCVRACVCVMLYYVGMCFYAEIEIKFIPPPGVGDKIFLFLYIFCCISESAFFSPKLHSWRPFSANTAAATAAAVVVSSTVRLFIEVTKVESGGWSCACSKWCNGSRSRASCSPVPPWLCSEGVDGIQNRSPWRFGMTGDTNYCSAASVSPPPSVFHTQRNTTLSLWSLTHTSAQRDHHYRCCPWETFWCWGMYCAVHCGDEGRGGQDVTGESRPSRLHGHKSVCSYKSRRSFQPQLNIDRSRATTWQGALPLSLKVVLVLLTAFQKKLSDYKLGYVVSVSVPSAIFTR